MSELDRVLIEKYRKIINFTDIQNISNNTIFKTSLNLNYLNVLNNVIINGYKNSIINADIITSNNILLRDCTAQSNLNTKNYYNYGKIQINNNILINEGYIYKNFVKDCSIYNNISILSNINSSNIYSNDVLTTLITSNSLILSSKNININSNNININGTINSIIVANLKITDNIINLNFDDINNKGFDNGANCGINIIGNHIGYIKTNNELTNFLINAPSNLTTNYILCSDYNNNLNIIGSSIINNNIIINNSLFVKDSLYCKNISVLSSLIYNNDLKVSKIYCGGLLNINNTYINNAIIKKLCINNNTLFNDSATFLSKTVVNNINISNNLQCYSNISILNSVVVENDIINNGKLNIITNMTSNNIFTVFGCIKNTISDSIYINRLNSNKKICNNISINSSITIDNNYVTSNLTCYSNVSINTITILSQPICTLLDCVNNLEALTNNIGLSQFYRTGDILKVRI